RANYILVYAQAKRENTQPCFPCNGTGGALKIELEIYIAFVFAETCRLCTGKGSVTVVLGGGETEVSQCINCEGAGSLTCTTCQGTGIQPRYLDRREFKDDD
ncbi:Protein disulfide-isomerase LQY1, chloroplastic, partial [Ananas comosus]